MPAQRASHAARASPRSAQPSTAPRPACLRAPARAAPRVPTAAELARRVAALRWQRTPRGSHDLRPRPRARLHLLVPVSSLTSPPALPSLFAKAESPKLCLSPRRAPAGGIRRGFPTSAGNPAPAAPPRPPSSCARICAAFRAQVEPPQSRHRRPWRRRARPPWKSPSSSSPAPPSYPTALTIFSRIACAR